MCSFNLNAVTHFNVFTNKRRTSEHVCAPCLGFWVLSVSCFTEGSLYVALPLNGSMRPKPNSLAGRSFGGTLWSQMCPLLRRVSHSRTSKLRRLLEREAWGVFLSQAEFQRTQGICIISHDDQRRAIRYVMPKGMIFGDCKHLPLLFILSRHLQGRWLRALGA